MRGVRTGSGEAGSLSRALTIFAWLPQDIASTGAPVERARDNEQQVGETVQVFFRGGADFFRFAQADDVSFRAAAHGTRQMTYGRGPGAAGKNEFLERRQICIEIVQRCFQALNLVFGNGDASGNAEFPAKIEKIVLDVRESGADVPRHFMGEQQTYDAVQFIHRADCTDTAAGFFHARAVSQAGRAVIAGTGIDFGKPMSHVQFSTNR